MHRQDGLGLGSPGQFPGFCGIDCTDCRASGNDMRVRFRQMRVDYATILPVPAEDGEHILFLLKGELDIDKGEKGHVILRGGQCYFFEKGIVKSVLSCSPSHIVWLNFRQSIVLYRQEFVNDVLRRKGTEAILSYLPPVLDMSPAIGRLLRETFAFSGLLAKPCYHYLRMVFVMMAMSEFHAPADLVRFFRSALHPKQDFRAFVLTHHARVRTVGEFAALAGMSKSVFEKRFNETFSQTAAVWMARQKAMEIRAAILGGIVSVKEIKAVFGFSSDSVMNRFFRTHFGGSPSKVIASITN